MSWSVGRRFASLSRSGDSRSLSWVEVESDDRFAVKSEHVSDHAVGEHSPALVGHVLVNPYNQPVAKLVELKQLDVDVVSCHCSSQ